ncbi:hypothetical protein ACFU5O_15105 [Streptomyces sp. NPDC057445]|uniref:hypothetical protein n=1 Tax=Streptomyces sp. NPDC057445 TaxID=3346136 RepID=UPI0036A3DAF1
MRATVRARRHATVAVAGAFVCLVGLTGCGHGGEGKDGTADESVTTGPGADVTEMRRLVDAAESAAAEAESEAAKDD